MAADTGKNLLEVSGDRTVDRVLASAAGALALTDDVELVLAASDADVGRILKAKVRYMRERLSLVRPIAKMARHTQIANFVFPKEPDGDTGPTANRQEIEQVVQAERRRLVTDKLLLTSTELQSALKLTRQAVSAATRAGRFFTVDVEGRAHYPAFLTDGGVDRNVLEAVAKLLGQLPGWTKYDFFVSSRGSLGGLSALEALRRGKIEQVERIARAVLAEEIR